MRNLSFPGIKVLNLVRYGAEMKKNEAEVLELDRQLAAIGSIQARSIAEAEDLQRAENYCSEIAQELHVIDDGGEQLLMELLVDQIDMVFPPDATTPGQGKAATPQRGIATPASRGSRRSGC